MEESSHRGILKDVSLSFIDVEFCNPLNWSGIESELWLMGGPGIFNAKPRRLAVSAWDGLRGLWAESKTKWEVSVTRRNANQKEKGEWILYQASPGGIRAWRCHCCTSAILVGGSTRWHFLEDQWHQASFCRLSGFYSLKRCWRILSNLTPILIGLSVFFPLFLQNLYVLDARHFVRYTCLHHFLLDSISLTCSWTLSQ